MMFLPLDPSTNFTALAKKVGVSRGHIYRILKEKESFDKMSLATFKKILDVTGLSYEEARRHYEVQTKGSGPKREKKSASRKSRKLPRPVFKRKNKETTIKTRVVWRRPNR